MQHCNQVGRAALFALGLLDEAELSTYERHLRTCAVCAAEVRESSELTPGLAGTLAAAIPPVSLRQRVLKEAMLPRGVAALVRGGRTKWQATEFAGVSISRLYEDPARGELASLVRIAPGARYPSHHHASLEHCYVLEGDLVFEDHTLFAGDYSAGDPGRDHTAATTTQGCLLFIVHNLRDQVHAV